jgi:hypothetical protein
MKKTLLIIYLTIITLTLQAQKDTTLIAGTSNQRYNSGEAASFSLNIFPVPVRDNTFTIKTDKDISFIKVTNIIGQDIFRIKYNNPQQLIKVSLDNPKRGMYLVTILFSDGLRVVKKIMVEQSE